MQTTHKHLHVIGIGGIGVSALARYYQHLGYSVSGSDGADSPFLETLRQEGFDIKIGHSADNIRENTDLVIYSEAIITKPDLAPEEQIYANPELARARDLGIRHLSYPVALGEVFNTKKGIAITGSHGKSTTTAMTGILLAQNSVNSEEWIVNSGEPGTSVLVGTQVPQFGGSNFHFEDSPHFVIEACEYKRSFLHYQPYITVITNIDIDHLDYYKNLDDYISAFQSIVDQTSGFVIISADDENSQKLNIPNQKKIIVGQVPLDTGGSHKVTGGFSSETTKQNASSSILGGMKEDYPTQPPLKEEEPKAHITYFPLVEELKWEKKRYHIEKTLLIPPMTLQVPGEHLLHDAHLAYTVGKLLGMQDDVIVPKLESYKGSWRRSEIVKTTKNGNILMSDYGHHPNEIRPTLRAIREKYADKKLFVVFQPHQYSRTRELLDEFAVSFGDVDTLIIPNIYFSRDKQEDVEWMTVEKLVEKVEKVEKADKVEKVEKGDLNFLDSEKMTKWTINNEQWMMKSEKWKMKNGESKNSPLTKGTRATCSVQNGNWLENTAKLIQEYDENNPNSSVILLLGAGDVDSLRYQVH